MVTESFIAHLFGCSCVNCKANFSFIIVCYTTLLINHLLPNERGGCKQIYRSVLLVLPFFEFKVSIYNRNYERTVTNFLQIFRLIDFHGMSTHWGLFHAYKLRIPIHCMLMFTLWHSCFFFCVYLFFLFLFFFIICFYQKRIILKQIYLTHI